MGYVPFTNDYSSLRTPAFVAAEMARLNARQTAVANIMANGNQVMGELVTECCSDPAFGGQGFYPAGVALGPTSPGGDVAALTAAMAVYPLTPVDILTGTNGFPVRANGRQWPRPRLSDKNRRARINAYPNFGAGVEASRLVPPCPCFSAAPPVALPVPVMVTPAPAAAPAPVPAPGPQNCPYPACSTGNVCLDLVTGCVSNSQVDPTQTQACALANYPVFGNSGAWLSAIMLGCGTNLPRLGTPLPNPPQADPSMYPTLKAAIIAGGMATSKARGTAGFGQVDSSNVGGFLAILGLFGIVVWANRK
jgi:hypothetical protein